MKHIRILLVLFLLGLTLTVSGASDAHAAYPTEHPVDPADLHATFYHCLGFDLTEPMYDHPQRPWPITIGRVIKALI